MDTMPTIEDHLRGRPESVAEMFSQILSTAQDRGHVDVEVIAKGVVLHGSRRIFAGLVPRDRGLGGMPNLLAPRENARFTKVEPLTRRIWKKNSRMSRQEVRSGSKMTSTDSA
jgi:hypothetical protein